MLSQSKKKPDFCHLTLIIGSRRERGRKTPLDRWVSVAREFW
jgi:hypothetical protein